MVTGTNINIDVTISSFTCEEVGGFGNKEYKIEFIRYKYLKIYTTDELKIVKFVKKTNTRPAPAAPANKGTYTVKSGDNLWSIARKYYGAAVLTGRRSTMQTNPSLNLRRTGTVEGGEVTADIGFIREPYLLFRTKEVRE